MAHLSMAIADSIGRTRGLAGWRCIIGPSSLCTPVAKLDPSPLFQHRFGFRTYSGCLNLT